MKRNDFIEQYKDPRWQKKRLEILQRDSFRCRSCTDDLTMLHIHHWRYDNNVKVWEYDNEDLVTLCETCHNAITSIDRMLKTATFGMETVVCVVSLVNECEMESIDKYLKLLEPRKDE
jgi:5-methylcytosine-specific restriction endonuclease McrA